MDGEDAARICESWYPVADELLCEAAELRAGERVLDFATGTGTTAMAAARRLCRTIGIDRVPQSVGRARERARIEGLAIQFQVAELTPLPFRDGSFDAVLSTFREVFQPDDETAASEMARVCRTGGRIGLTNWTSSGRIGQCVRTLPTYPGKRLGEEEQIHRLFGPHAGSIRIARRWLRLRHELPEKWADYYSSLLSGCELPAEYLEVVIVRA